MDGGEENRRKLVNQSLDSRSLSASLPTWTVGERRYIYGSLHQGITQDRLQRGIYARGAVQRPAALIHRYSSLKGVVVVIGLIN